MFKLKLLHPNAISRAVERAERYRLLNEPWQAESICRDVLAVDGANQPAIVTLILAVTDQFGPGGTAMSQAKELLPLLEGGYERVYYGGVICERWARSALAQQASGSEVYEWFVEAMRQYEQAEKLSPTGNDDAVLRWNACVRQMEKHPHVLPHAETGFDEGFGDHVPSR